MNTSNGYLQPRHFLWGVSAILLAFGVGCSSGDAVTAAASPNEDVSGSTVGEVSGSTVGVVSGSSFQDSVDLHKAAIAACMSEQGFDIENPPDFGEDEIDYSFIGGIREAQNGEEQLPEPEELEEFTEAFLGPDDSEQGFTGGCIGAAADESGVTDNDLKLYFDLWEEADVYSLTEKERACLSDLAGGVDVEALSGKQLWDEVESVIWQQDMDENQELIEALAEAVEPGLSSSLSSDFVFGDGVYSSSAFVDFLRPRGFLPLSETKLAELETIESSLGHRPFGTFFAPCDIDTLRMSTDGILEENPDLYDAAPLWVGFMEFMQSMGPGE